MRRQILVLTLIFLFVNSSFQAQNILEPKNGYSPQTGVIVSMLEDLKARVSQSVDNLDQEDVDFLLDENSNRIGAMIFHLAATEKYYQLFTFENRGFNKEEKEKWMVPLELGDTAREELINKPIGYYLAIWNDVRDETLELLKTKDDKWLNSKVKRTTMNNHWAWYHVMEHQANHMGQIRLVMKRSLDKQ
ncbi:MAG: DinB family protein [Gillisia sp.]